MQVDPRPWQRGAVNVGGAPRNDETIGKEPPIMTTQETAAAACSAIGLTMKAEYLPHKRKPQEHLEMRWRVTLLRNGRAVHSTDFTQGCAHSPEYKRNGGKVTAPVIMECETGFTYKPGATFGRPVPPPDVADVVYCFLLDSSDTDETFEEWAAGLGYDPDSRTAEKIFNSCRDTASALRRAFTPAELDALKEAFLGY